MIGVVLFLCLCVWFYVGCLLCCLGLVWFCYDIFGYVMSN